jgi:serine/threonine protein kinase
MQLTTCPPPPTLAAFLLGKLSDGEAEEIAAHLDDCAACDRQAAALEADADSFVSEIKRPTGEASLLEEQNFRRAAERVAALGAEPTDAGVDRRLASAPSPLGTLGQYRLLEKLGAGGMGAVYKALHTRLEKVVAVKVLPADRLQDAAAIARFDREMKAVGRLDHPHIVRAMDAGEDDGVHYLVMEYVAGNDLSSLSRRLGPLPIADACELVRQAAIGLAHAHEFGLVHRDVKPGNLILGQSATVKILDLGLALLADGPASPERDLTSTGQMMGTLDYMAPEQGSDSHVVDARADVYALGATLYKLLTGAPIYSGAGFTTAVQKVTALATLPAPPIQSRRGDVPDALAAIVHRMLEKDPAQRYATASAVAAALAPFTDGANLAALAERVATADAAFDTVADGSHSRVKAATIVNTSARPTPVTARHQQKHNPRPAWLWPTILMIALGLAGIGALAAVFLLQTPQGSVTVEIDPELGKDVTVTVSGDGQRIKLNDASGWEVSLREGTYDVDMSGSADRLKLSRETVTIRRGETEVVRVTLKPEPVAEALPDELPPASVTRKPGSDAVAWLVKHNSFGPDSELVGDAQAKIARYVERGVGFEYRLAGPLLASGKPTILAVHGPKMFVHELTGPQAEAMKLIETPIAGFRSGPEQIGRRAARPEFELTGMRLDDEETLGKNGKITGWVDYRRLREGEPKAHYFVRVVFMVDKALTVAQGIAGDLADERGTIRLQLDSPLPEGWTHAGTSMFVELGRFDRPDDFHQFVALSDPISRVIVLQQATPTP